MNAILQKTVKNYGYPGIVLEVVSEFLDVVLDVFKGNDVGVLLVGSTSRGELCWASLDERLILFSDIEFMIAVNSESSGQKRELAQRINELSCSYDLGERFHLDYVVNDWSKLKYLQKKIFIFDCKATGVDLTKHQIKDCLPDVKIKNLDFKELNDVLLHRMKALINDIPENILDKNPVEKDFLLSIAKNALDITTWLYPYEADKLVSGFECRLDAWDERYTNMLLSDYFDKDDFLFLRECLHIRKAPSESYNEILLLHKFVMVYEKAIKYCKAMNSIDSNVAIDNATISAKLFDEFKIRRRLAEAYCILLHYRMFSFSNIVSNIFLPRKGRQIKFCITMIKAIVERSYFSENDFISSSGEDIKNARQELNALREVQIKHSESFLDEWKILRREYLLLNKIFI